MGIFLNETVANAIRHGSKRGNSSARMQGLVKRYGVRESVINKTFGYEDAGFQICYESEVAWNSLNESMQLAEVKALQEGALGSFWGKIKEWAKKVIAFFVRIWQSIVAWVKKVWGKIVGVFVKTDSELYDKLYDLTTSEKVERIVYKNINFGEKSDAKVNQLGEILKSIYGTVDNSIKQISDEKLSNTKKSEDYKTWLTTIDRVTASIDKEVDKIEKNWQKTQTYMKDWEKKQAVKITRNNCLDELRDFDDRMEKLIDFIKDSSDFTDAGTKAAEEALEIAEKNEEESRNISRDAKRRKDGDIYKDVSKKGKVQDVHVEVDETDDEWAERKTGYDANYKINQYVVRVIKKGVDICRNCVNYTTSNAQKLKNIYFHNHNMCRSAASELIRLAKKKTA